MTEPSAVLDILTVIPNFYPAVKEGGTVFTSWHTARELARARHAVRVVTTDAHANERLDVATDRWVEPEPGLRVRYYRETIPGRLSLPLACGLWRTLSGADVVHVQTVFASSTPLALLFAKMSRVPVLLTPHGMLAEWCLTRSGPRLLKKLWLNLLIRPFANRILWQATAQQEVREIRAIFPHAKVCMIPNGIDVREFDECSALAPEAFVARYLPAGTPVTEHTKIVVSMGRLHAKKGMDILFEAFAGVRERHPDTLLVVAGPDGGERDELLIRRCMLGIESHAFVIEPLSGKDKLDFLASADVFALPSHNENFGVVYAEALSCGTPVLASVHTPWSEVEEQGCGRWAPNDVASVGAALDELLCGDTDAMGARGRDWVLAAYDWRTIAGRFVKTFQALSAGEEVPECTS